MSGLRKHRVTWNRFPI